MAFSQLENTVLSEKLECKLIASIEIDVPHEAMTALTRDTRKTNPIKGRIIRFFMTLPIDQTCRANLNPN
jgi:hypothetical protein